MRYNIRYKNRNPKGQIEGGWQNSERGCLDDIVWTCECVCSRVCASVCVCVRVWPCECLGSNLNWIQIWERADSGVVSSWETKCPGHQDRGSECYQNETRAVQWEFGCICTHASCVSMALRFKKKNTTYFMPQCNGNKGTDWLTHTHRQQIKNGKIV